MMKPYNYIMTATDGKRDSDADYFENDEDFQEYLKAVIDRETGLDYDKIESLVYYTEDGREYTAI